MAVSIQLEKGEKSELKKVFSLYGRKKDFKDKTGISYDALGRLLENGRASERVVKEAREYVASL